MLLPPPAPTTSDAEVFLLACLLACLLITESEKLRLTCKSRHYKKEKRKKKKNGEKAYYPDTLDMDLQGSAGSERTVD